MLRNNTSQKVMLYGVFPLNSKLYIFKDLMLSLAHAEYMCHILQTILSHTLRGKSPNTEFFLVRISLYTD